MTEEALSEPLLRPSPSQDDTMSSTSDQRNTESSYLLSSLRRSNHQSVDPLVLFILDALWSLNIVFPLIVVYWSGTWYLLDVYVTPKDYLLSAVICVGIGTAIILLVFHIMPVLSRLVSVRCSLLHVLVSRTIIYVSAFGVLIYFRGVWNLVNPLLQENVILTAVVTVLCQLLLVLLRAAGNSAGSPLVLGLDTAEDFYIALPRFRTSPTSVFYHSLDILFSLFICQTLCVLLWVGLWQLADVFILPNSLFLSLIVSLCAGYVGCSLIFALQRPLERKLQVLYARNNWAAMSVEALYNIVSTLAVLLLWRGLWGLSQSFLLVGERGVKVGWIFHVLGFFVMSLLQVGRTLGSIFCSVDGEVGGRGIAHRTEYFAYIYRLYISSRQISYRVNERNVQFVEEARDETFSDVEESDERKVEDVEVARPLLLSEEGNGLASASGLEPAVQSGSNQDCITVQYF